MLEAVCAYSIIANINRLGPLNPLRARRGGAERRGLFTDVPEGSWYTDAVIWAANNGIVSGIDLPAGQAGGGLFGPDDNISRQDLAVILNNYAVFAGLKLPVNRSYTGFNDEADMAGYATEAIERLYRAGVISGKPGNAYDPMGSATRAEVATMLMNFLHAVDQALADAPGGAPGAQLTLSNTSSPDALIDRRARKLVEAPVPSVDNKDDIDLIMNLLWD